MGKAILTPAAALMELPADPAVTSVSPVPVSAVKVVVVAPVPVIVWENPWGNVTGIGLLPLARVSVPPADSLTDADPAKVMVLFAAKARFVAFVKFVVVLPSGLVICPATPLITPAAENVIFRS